MQAEVGAWRGRASPSMTLPRVHTSIRPQDLVNRFIEVVNVVLGVLFTLNVSYLRSSQIFSESISTESCHPGKDSRGSPLPRRYSRHPCSYPQLLHLLPTSSTTLHVLSLLPWISILQYPHSFDLLPTSVPILPFFRGGNRVGKSQHKLFTKCGEASHGIGSSVGDD